MVESREASSIGSTMLSAVPGAALVMRLREDRFSNETVGKMLDYLFSLDYQVPAVKEIWCTPVGRERRLSTAVERRLGTAVDVYWQPLKPGVVGPGDRSQYNLDPRNKLEWPGNSSVWLAVWLFQHNLSPTDSPKVGRVVEVFKQLVRIAQPDFAAVDWYAHNMAKRKGKEPRLFAWGAMYFDARHVERIGIEKRAHALR